MQHGYNVTNADAIKKLRWVSRVRNWFKDCEERDVKTEMRARLFCPRRNRYEWQSVGKCRTHRSDVQRSAPDTGNWSSYAVCDGEELI